MTLSAAQLREMAARATSLWERLAGDVILDAAPSDEEAVEAKLTRWRRFVADGNDDLFERRLAMDGLTVADARRACGRPRLRDDAPLPVWTATLSAVMALCDQCEADRSRNPDRPLPMEEVFLPFIRFARSRIADSPHAAALSSVAHGGFEQDLLHTLSDICANALVREFFAFRSAQQSPLERGP